ncbi:MAG: hypothetical protein COB41_06370 [Proteobacteria bacterium]|nr:hypothetical protein [bacterium AH-315-G11]PCI43744.1 MAG: hypothetical protein COB41_06370 [Pseudomonadota bacterium]
MKLPNKDLLQDPDFQNARIAMKRARLKAIEKAKQTNNKIVVFEQGKVVYMQADTLVEKLL